MNIHIIGIQKEKKGAENVCVCVCVCVRVCVHIHI